VAAMCVNATHSQATVYTFTQLRNTSLTHDFDVNERVLNQHNVKVPFALHMCGVPLKLSL